jgi:hypothetical protein
MAALVYACRFVCRNFSTTSKSGFSMKQMTTNTTSMSIPVADAGKSTLTWRYSKSTKHYREPGLLPFNSESMLLGPAHSRRFRCGFCKSVQTIGASGDWYQSYYLHIARHFNGIQMYNRVRRNTIASWIHLPNGE